MLNSEMIGRIEKLVYAKPRSIDEIAKLIGKNWRTADRYIGEIQKNFGTISVRVFREGTRGALKIVYWSSVEKASHSAFQEKLEEEILMRHGKNDFSAFDIFQHVSDDKKKAIVEKSVDENSTNLTELRELLEGTRRQLLIFSGNLSFVNLKSRNFDFIRMLEGLIKRNVSIKIICRVDIVGLENIEKVLSLNYKYGKELIEIRHREQPLRAILFDNAMFRIKEIKEPTGKIHELENKIFIFYTIKDKEWTEWLSRVFWKMFSQSIDAKRRIEEMKKLHKH